MKQTSQLKEEPKTFSGPLEHAFRLNEEVNHYIESMTRSGKRFSGKETANESKDGVDWVVIKVNFRDK